VASISYRVDGGLVTTQVGATAVVPIVQQGTVQLDYWATDAVGNVETTRSLQLRVDSVAPTTPANLRISSDTGASGTDFVTSATQQTVTGTAEPGSTVELSYRGSVVGTATTAADGTFRVGPQPVVAGSFPMSVRSIDPAGNGSGGATVTLVVDTTAPAPAITFPLDAGSYTSSTWAKGCPVTGLCGTASDTGSGVSAVLYELRNVTAGTCWNGSSFSAAPCGTLRSATGTSSWAVPVAYASLPRSKNLQLSVYVDDLAGNRSALLERTFRVK
jgi:large repetitive protein